MPPRRQSTRLAAAAPGPSPPSSSTAAPRPHRPPAPSFASLPPELKSLIAEHVHASDEQERRERARRPRTFSGEPDVNLELEREIRRLMGREGAVSTDELVKTMHLDLRSRTSKDVHFYLTTIAPRHADVVTTACFEPLSNVARDRHRLDSIDWPGEDTHAEMQKRLVAAAEQLGDFFHPDDEFSTRLVRMPGIFTGEILKNCINLRRVNTGTTSSASLGIPSCPSDALRGLLASGATLSTLVCSVDVNSDSSLEAYTALLAASTGLKSLRLHGTAGDHARTKDLWAAICRLPCLVHLELSDFSPPKPEDLTIAWQLDHLSLDCTGGAPPSTLAPFFSLVSDTLTSLDYTYIVSGFASDRTHDHPLPPSRPFSLPHLTDLVCNDEAAVETLPYFVNSPLRTLTLVPYRLSARRGAINLIKGCRSTLRHVRLHGPQDGFYQGMPEDVAPVCAQYGIEYVEVVEGVEQKRR
ncbi:hypothetical protein JCM8097_005484 [Rhodosporidiobolus ruineniae]